MDDLRDVQCLSSTTENARLVTRRGQMLAAIGARESSLTEAAKLVRVAIRHTPIEVANRVSIADTMTRPVTWQ